MTEWQPIDTAPKDGSDVLLYADFCYTAFWDGSFRGWVDNARGSLWPIPATHWMPLPEAPKP